MSLIGKPINGQRTKFCFVYCGPERCDCQRRVFVPEHPMHPHPKGGVQEKKDPFEEAMDVVKPTKGKDTNG